MSLTTMYPAANNSPSTVLIADLSSNATTMTVDDPSVLPAAPNLAVLGTSDNAEIVLYTEISGNDLTIVRGQNGTTPGTWNSGTTVARNFTAADHEAFRENILDLENRKTDSGHTHDDRYYTETEMNTALALKTNNSIIAAAFSTGSAYAEGDYCIYEGALYRFTSAHSAGAWNSSHVTQIVIGDELKGKAPASHTHDDRYYTETEIDGKFAKEIMYFTAQTVSATSNAQIMRIPASGTNSNITTDTVVLNCTFAAPANITSNVSWTSYAGYVTFSGTCTAATTADVTLGTKGN